MVVRTTVGVLAAPLLVLVTVGVTLVTDRPIAAVHPVVPVALHELLVVLEVVVTEEVSALPPEAVPVLPAVPGVGVPTVLHVGAVHLVAAVRGGGGGSLAVLVTLVTDRTFPTVSQLLVVAAIVDEVEHLRPAGGRVVGAHVVLPRFHSSVAAPVLSAVE